MLKAIMMIAGKQNRVINWLVNFARIVKLIFLRIIDLYDYLMPRVLLAFGIENKLFFKEKGWLTHQNNN